MRSFVLLILFACSTALVASTLPPTSPTALEPIHLFTIANGVVSIGVATTGYTTAQSFRVDVAKGETNKVCTLRIVRIKRDEGKAMPGPTVITYTLADLKIDARLLVKVENPFCSADDY